ncbi:oligopeptide/dipeptide ABC transporter, ATPase subunit [Staphylothermus marinus F1]|uniref:Oligopeptide/dipeptide ABC transporter, ATPase subunit n=1 Tax=Staphylothermus marinus (strain ATCC 43588 / DSM 3639 / JCM 9404 / F1) TaxID=399550 RepID=A3DL74_STAMF|nr:ABC transporter ATP-binding protein [Staphylothermus marinus]ABN69384.1 oligopeptide/dipeptide ABC transporter, ATPase subunit [Staphylothermus marinus F1]
MVLAVKAENLWIGYMDEEENILWAVRGISIEVLEREIYCLVGESGCGKSTLGNAIVGILPPYSVTKGRLRVFNREVIVEDEKHYEEIRGKLVTLIPQNPGKALNPYLTISEQFYYVFNSLYELNKENSLKKARELLGIVGLDPEQVLDSYPHELSGGMQQRTAIALALATGAKIVVADEPTSALDANLRLQLLKLLLRLKNELGLTIIMITHDILSATRICDRVAVMYAGKIVEETSTREIIENPLHPYTKMLFDAVPILGVKKKLVSYLGEPPRPGEYIKGCQFSKRCPKAMDICREKEPEIIEINGHRVACWLYNVEGGEK